MAAEVVSHISLKCSKLNEIVLLTLNKKLKTNYCLIVYAKIYYIICIILIDLQKSVEDDNIFCLTHYAKI